MSEKLTNVDNVEELVERIDMPDSPFTIIGIEGEYFGAMGKHRLTEKSESLELIKAELNQITWNRIIQVIMIMTEQREQILELLKTDQDAG